MGYFFAPEGKIGSCVVVWWVGVWYGFIAGLGCWVFMGSSSVLFVCLFVGFGGDEDGEGDGGGDEDGEGDESDESEESEEDNERNSCKLRFRG